MANSIALAQKYLAVLDEVYKQGAKTAGLEATSQDVKFINANTVQLFKMDMDGLGNYDRNNGFVDGSVTGTWETMTLTQDRGRSFNVDAMDDEETIGMSFGKLAGEFLRTKVIPEVDAYTFAKIAGTQRIQAGTPIDLANITNVADEIDKAIAALNEKEAPEEGRILYISEKAYGKLKGNIVRTIENDATGINKTVEYYDGCKIVRVPQSRFLSAITLKTGASGQTDGGYVGATTNYDLHFLLVAPSAIKKVTKHAVPRIFTPAENQSADAWKFDYRLYYDVFVEENKVDGIYMLRANTAN